MSRECDHKHEELIDFVEGDLAAERADEIDAHLKVCKECAAYVESIKRTFSVLTDDTIPEPPPGYWAYLPQKVRQQAGARRRRHRVLVFAPGMAALAVVLMLIWWGTRAPVPEITTLEMITAELATEDLLESVSSNEVYEIMFVDAAAEEMTSLDQYFNETEDIYDLIGNLSDAEAEAFVAELDNLMRADEGTSEVMTDTPGKEC
ncbi:MAG: zf-HC2 domain-containing protein [Candidatus Eisenbacteria bacterium]